MFRFRKWFNNTFNFHKFKTCKDLKLSECGDCYNNYTYNVCFIVRKINNILYGINPIKENIIDLIKNEHISAPLKMYKKYIINQLPEEHQDLYDKLSLLK